MMLKDLDDPGLLQLARKLPLTVLQAKLYCQVRSTLGHSDVGSSTLRITKCLLLKLRNSMFHSICGTLKIV